MSQIELKRICWFDVFFIIFIQYMMEMVRTNKKQWNSKNFESV